MTEVSPQLRTFIEQRLSTLEQIEIVLLLRGDPARSWTALEVANAVGTAPEAAAMRLFLLASGGLLALEASGVPRYRYAAVDAETAARLQELADVYAADRNSIANIVDAGARDPIRSFADAFKLKK